MIIKYYLYSPTRNNTILVETPVSIAEQADIAARLLKAEPSAEQVGFLSGCLDLGNYSLRMAGGEFCGNASMSAAAHLSRSMEIHEHHCFLLNVSGAEDAVRVDIRPDGNGCWCGTVQMPEPLSILHTDLPLSEGSVGLPVVRFPGIDHIIIESPPRKDTAEYQIKRWCRLLGSEALGLMFLEGDRLTPLVYVPALESLYWEQSCASGTTAVGAFLAHRAGSPVSVTLQEPGGPLRIVATEESLLLSGTVAFIRENEIDL